MDSSQKNKIEGGGNSAEDEGISSSEQDDCEEEVSSKKVKVPYKMYSVSQGDTTIDEVLEDFDKVINDASTESGGGGGGVSGRKVSSVSSNNSKRYYEYSETDDVVIIPTRIVPEPPRRSRSLFMNKNFEVNPFFEDDEESVDSECAYEEDEEDDELKSKIKRSEMFHSVQKQIKRFSDLALHSHRVEDEEKNVNKDGGRRKSIYNVFGDAADAENRMYPNSRPVTRSASTRNINDSRIPAMRFDHCKSERSVYLPMGCKVAKEPKVFMTRGHNNAGLYSGYKDTTSAAVATGKDPSPKTCKLQNSGGSSNGLKALHHVNMSVSTGKLTDFPSGLY